jgi:hypothetical protein
MLQMGGVKGPIQKPSNYFSKTCADIKKDPGAAGSFSHQQIRMDLRVLLGSEYDYGIRYLPVSVPGFAALPIASSRAADAISSVPLYATGRMTIDSERLSVIIGIT